MPEQKRARKTGPYIAAELVEEILLNLPVKSLLRFSTVSRSWNSMILGAEFATRYRGRELMALRVYSDDEKYLICPISALSTDNAAAPPFSLPFKSPNWYTDVSCGGLRCVELGNTVCLYNPSTREYRKLPPPFCPPQIGSTINAGRRSSVHVYGLGYDSASGDYKIMKAHLDLYGETELYSLKSDRWRKVRESKTRIQLCINANPKVHIRFITRKGVFVSGVLYWLVSYACMEGGRYVQGIVILTFDVSAEDYGNVALPPLPESFEQMPCSTDILDVCVLRGRLGVSMNHRSMFLVWVMEDNGGWKKDLAFDYGHIHPLRYSYLKPFYFYDGAGSLVKAVTSPTSIRNFFIVQEEENGSSTPTLVEKSFGSKGYGIVASFTYVESLASPFHGKR